MGEAFNAEFFKYLASLGVGGSIAGLMFYWYRRDVQTYTDQWRGQTEILVGVVKDNTKIMAELVTMIRAMHHRFDQMEK